MNTKNYSFEKSSKLESIYEMPTTHKKEKNLNEFNQLHRGSFGAFPNTQRKSQEYDLAAKNYMDKITTPLKYDSIKSNSIGNNNVSQNSKYRQILLKLDESEQKLVISQKKYGQLWRKYESSCDSIKSLNKQLRHSQQKNLQQLYDMKTKLQLLEKQNLQNLGQLKLKQIENETLRQSLNQSKAKLYAKQQNVQILEIEIQKIMLEKKNQSQMIQRLQDELKSNRQQKTRSYERIIQTLKRQIESLHQELQQKVSQIHQLRQSIYNQQKKTFSSAYISSQSDNLSFQNHLSTLHQQKLSLIKTYQQKISSLQSSHKFQIQKFNQQVRQELQKELEKYVQIKLQKEEHQTKSIIEEAKLKELIEELRRENRELSNKIIRLQTTNKQLQQQVNMLMTTIQSSNKSIDSLYLNQSRQMTFNSSHQYKQLLFQLQSIKKSYNHVQASLQQKQAQICQYRQKNIDLSSKIKIIQGQIRKRDLDALDLNKKHKNADQMLIQKLKHLQRQYQQMQRQLLTQRLENANLKQQLEEQSSNLKRQYQLSLQNVKCELQNKIKEVKEQKNLQIVEKQKIYLQMRELQRKYQLLVSEMLTVDDMMTIATKVHKRNSKFVKR